VPKLTIQFFDMFLYVRRKGDKQNIVLLPSGGNHEATIEGSGLKEVLTKTEITFCTKEGDQFKRIPGSQRPEPAAHVRLIDLQDILGSQGAVDPKLLDANDLSLLNARVVLPNGRAVAWEATKHKAADVEWTFEAKGNMPAIEGQEITDNIQVQIDAPNTELFALFNGGGAKKLQAAADLNYYVRFHNADRDCKGSSKVPPGKYTLGEYQFLYELTKADKVTYRYPTGVFPESREQLEGVGFAGDFKKTSKCLPICGGADCPEG
jgi:hypothetical protein